MTSVDNSIHEWMNYDDSKYHTWNKNIPTDNWEDIHECCESPSIDIITHSNKTLILQSEIDNDSTVLYAIHECLLSNSSNRLNSPPNCWLLFNDSLKNTYVSLTGIVKNNS
jgi:hypothetical protein